MLCLIMYCQLKLSKTKSFFLCSKAHNRKSHLITSNYFPLPKALRMCLAQYQSIFTVFTLRVTVRVSYSNVLSFDGRADLHVHA